jgi:hypothetical protein
MPADALSCSRGETAERPTSIGRSLAVVLRLSVPSSRGYESWIVSLSDDFLETGLREEREAVGARFPQAVVRRSRSGLGPVDTGEHDRDTVGIDPHLDL